MLVSDPPAPGSGADLSFMGPLSAARADSLVAELSAAEPATVLDLGSGWAELLLRILRTTPGAVGTGVDTFGPDLKRARQRAEQLGVSDRLTLVERPAADVAAPADLVLNLGAFQAFGTTVDALRELYAHVNSGGRLLFGAEYWVRPPTPGELARMWPGISADDNTDLAGLVDQAVAAGFRPLHVQTVTEAEWDEFESGLAVERERWLLTDPDHPEAAAVAAELDKQRALWLRGYRGILGFAYLTLGKPVDTG